MYFSKELYAVYNGSGVKPQKLGNFREFLCYKYITLVCKASKESNSWA